MKTPTPPLVIQLKDADTERVRRNHELRLAELAGLPLARGLIVPNVLLVDGVATEVVHALGRRPSFVKASDPRGPSTSGRIEEVRAAGASHDPTQRLVLKASGWGATITVDVLVM